MKKMKLKWEYCVITGYSHEVGRELNTRAEVYKMRVISHTTTLVNGRLEHSVLIKIKLR